MHIKPSIKPLVLLLLLVITGWFMLPPARCNATTAKEQYASGNRAFRQLQKSPKKLQYRDNWMKCIDKFQNIFLTMPNDPWAPAAMYRSAQLYLDLYKFSYAPQDKKEAIDLLQRTSRRYPKSAYRNRSLKLLTSLDVTAEPELTTAASTRSSSVSPPVNVKRDQIPRKKALKNKWKKKTGTTKSTPMTESAPIASQDAVITDIRHWSNPSYTRVVIDIAKGRKFTHALLEKNPTLNKPMRLFLDIENSRLGKNIPKHTYINDHLLTQARAGQHTPHSVRVVIDIKSFDTYNVFSLNDPFRVVVDVWAAKPIISAVGPSQASKKPFSPSPTSPTNKGIVQQLALGVKTIVIDPGHGGKDPGAMGYQAGVKEKDVVLKIARKLEKRMKARLGCNIIMTRTTDKYLPLESRTAIANTRNADLFISLHCNAAKNRNLTGVETYFLNLATDDDAVNVAARENATSRKNISDLEDILNGLMQNAKINESGRLATHVQGAICTGLSKKYKYIHNLGVKKAPFYVLLGATMPSILIETSFISNKRECRRLLNENYQNYLCETIIDGIESYIKETNPEKFVSTQ